MRSICRAPRLLFGDAALLYRCLPRLFPLRLCFRTFWLTVTGLFILDLLYPLCLELVLIVGDDETLDIVDILGGVYHAIIIEEIVGITAIGGTVCRYHHR